LYSIKTIFEDLLLFLKNLIIIITTSVSLKIQRLGSVQISR